jgi:hypothetical protein
MKTRCCDKMSFQRLTQDLSPLADPGKAEGVEFTLGTCKNCQRLLMHCWVASGVSEGYEIVDSRFVEQLRAASDRQSRKKLLADWWNSLESHKPISEP